MILTAYIAGCIIAPALWAVFGLTSQRSTLSLDHHPKQDGAESACGGGSVNFSHANPTSQKGR